MHLCFSCLITNTAFTKGGRCVNGFVDIHGHILADMPHSYADTVTAIQAINRLEACAEKYCKTIIAAPLFQPDLISEAAFLSQRDAAVAGMCDFATTLPKLVRVAAGAVVPMNETVFSLRQPERFTLAETRYLLVAPPERPYDASLPDFFRRTEITMQMHPIIADIDRYFELYSLEELLSLRESRILTQISVKGLLDPQYRKLALYLIGNGVIQFVATGNSPLDLPEAMRALKRSLPLERYKRIKANSRMLLSGAEPETFLAD